VNLQKHAHKVVAAAVTQSLSVRTNEHCIVLSNRSTQILRLDECCRSGWAERAVSSAQPRVDSRNGDGGKHYLLTWHSDRNVANAGGFAAPVSLPYPRGAMS
jgi:hypothetical protein